ncbi:MAG: rod shape-determining protein MreC [Candidatus Omnitrophota bacterium]
MFKFKDKNIIYAACLASLLVLFSFLIPALRKPALDILELPLELLTLVKREINGLIFFHRNYLQNDRLKKENELLRNNLNATTENLLENKRLKELLSLKQEASYQVIVARVIGRGADSWSSAIIIDKGQNNGVRRGLTAISYLGLVGRVIEAGVSTSKIMLINAPQMGVSALVQRSRQEGLVSGSMGSNLVMKYLPKDSDIEVSDTVITSGLTDVYPKGLLIGKVIDVGEEFSGLSSFAIIEPATNLSSIEEVLIIVK